MLNKNIFKRDLERCPKDDRILIDPDIKDRDYVDSFGFEWTTIDGFVGKETMSHGHIFGRFMLPGNYFDNKTVVDIGCGNGRIGRLVAPMCKEYFGCDLSEAVYSFPDYLDTKNITLVRTSGTNLPFADTVADVAVCWGVLHHMDEPMKGLEELERVTKDGGEILIFIYSKGYDARKNLNEFSKCITEENKYQIIESTSDLLDNWREVDSFYANELSKNLFLSVKKSREWQIFQWFDGISPQFHWSLETELEEYFKKKGILFNKTHLGCFRIKKK